MNDETLPVVVWEGVPRQSAAFLKHRGVLDRRKLGSAFGATTLDHFATTSGLHLNEKAVRLCALPFLWLVRSFHDGISVTHTLLTCLCPHHKFW